MLTYNPTLLNAAATRLFVGGANEAAGESYIPTLATVFNSNKKSEIHARTGASPALEQFRGRVNFTPVADSSVSATNIKYVAGIQISEDDIADDQLQGFKSMASEMGTEAILLPNYLLMLALIDATGKVVAYGVGYEGGREVMARALDLLE